MDLGKTSLFRGVDAADLAAVQALAVRKDVIAGNRVFAPDQPPNALLLIEMGSVEVRAKDKDIRVVTLGSGQLLAVASFFAPGEHSYVATATETTRLLAYPADALHRLLDERPGLALVLYRNAARQFAEMLRQMAPMLDHPYV